MAESSLPTGQLPTDKLGREKPRDYSMFDAELSGAALNMHLLGRLTRKSSRFYVASSSSSRSGSLRKTGLRV